MNILDKTLNKIGLQRTATKNNAPKIRDKFTADSPDYFTPIKNKTAEEQKRINDSIILGDNLINVMNTASAIRRDVTNPANNYYASMWTLDYKQLENIFMTTWIGKKLITLPTKYMFKNGFTIKIEGQKDLEDKALKFYKDKKLQQKLIKAIAIKKIYGGGIILPKHKLQDPALKYDLTKFKGVEDLEFVVRDLSYLAVMPNIDILSEKYFEPQTISLTGLQVLADNCIIFKGIQAPLRRMPQFRYIGMSIYQNIYQALINDDYISKGITNMVHRGNMKYYKLEGFADLVKQGYDELATSRISTIEDHSSHLNAGILDKNDEVEWVQQSFASLPEIDERSLERLSAATDIPSMVLLGRAPKSTGLGSDSNGELENFYNYIEDEQEENTEAVTQMFRIICAILSGRDDLEIEVKFNKPHNVDPKVQVDTDKVILENMTAQQSLGFPDDIIKDYGVQKGLLTEEQANDITELTNEMLELERQSLEQDSEGDNGSKVQPKANKPKKKD